MKDKKKRKVPLTYDQGERHYVSKTTVTKTKKKKTNKGKSEEDFERPRRPDEQDIGVDIVLEKPIKPFAELRLNALDYSRRLESVAPTPGISNWVQMGPVAAPNGQALFGTGILVTGRITSIVIDPTDARIIYIGAALGGVWKTIDGGGTWNPTSDNEQSLAIGALAIDPSNHSVVYAGTGEGNYSDSYYGAGILKTTNGGSAWTLVNHWEDPTVPTSGTFTGSNFCRIAINPVTTTTIFAAGASGLFRSTDSGSTWIRMSNGVPLNYATDVIINPANADIVYAAFREKGIFQTTNANATTPAWNKLTGGLPATSGFRISLSISPSSPQVVYALMSDSGGNLINQFYNTTDDGNTWKSIPMPNGNIGGQGFYNLNIAVDPNTPDIVYLGAISLWKASHDATTGTWNFTDIGGNIHVDNHAFAFDPKNSSVIYAGNDGGIYKSTDGGTTWIDSINKGLCITQFEFLDKHPTSDAFVMAGTQDNGTEQFRNSPVFYHAAYGDGGYAAIDQTQPNNMIHGHYGRRFSRSVEGGKLGSWTDISSGLSGGSLDYPPLVFDRSNQNNVAFGGERIFLDSAQGTGGWPISITLPNLSYVDRVSAIDYVDTNLIYVGTKYGKVYRLVNSGGGVWTATAIDAPPLSTSKIQDIMALPNDHNTVVLVMVPPISNVWRGVVAQDGGSAAWTDISGVPPQPVLPKIPANALEIEPSSPNIMYVGTDIGVFRTTDAGNSWSLFSDGLPNSAVFDMRLHAPKRLLRVATHGRGMWERKLDTPTMLDTDIFVRDDLMETGRFPSTYPVTAAFEDPLHYVSLNDQLGWWMCADIKIDSPEVPPGGTQPAYQYPNVSDVDYVVFESKLQHRNPSRGNVAHVYVQVQNRGIAAAKNVRVKILYHDAAAGPYILPSDFWTAFPNDSTDITKWVPIGTNSISSLSPTMPSILEWDWSVPPGLSDHSCILVVADSLDDPIPGQNQVFDVGILVPTEKHVGLKNLHIVNPTFTTLYWTAFTFNSSSQHVEGSEASNIIIPPSNANGWKLGIIFQRINPPEQPVLNGITARNPTRDMINSLKQKIGSEINDYDTSVIYMINSIDRGGSLTNVRIPPGGRLKSMLLFIRPGEDTAEGKVTIIQEQKEEEGKRSTTLGGSTFVLKGLVGKLTRELKKRKQQKQKDKRVGKHK
jgi:photosystem II stability/assembly factor-like uncharacterized protein